MITIIDAYIDSMLGKYKIRTVTAYKHDLIHFSNWVTAQHALIDIQNLSVSIVADYFEYILKNTVLTTTIRRKRAALRNFLDFCHKQNYNNLVLHISWPSLRHKTMHNQSAPQIVDNMRDQLLLMLAQETSLGLQQIIQLQKQHINHHNKSLMINELSDAAKAKEILLSSTLYKTIVLYAQTCPTDTLFVFTRASLNAHLRRLQSKIEAIPATHCHALPTTSLIIYKNYHPRA